MNTLEQLIADIQADDNLKHLEVFKSTYTETENEYGEIQLDLNGDDTGTGWFYWFSLPGCLPDSEAFGPFETEQEALADALNQFGSID